MSHESEDGALEEHEFDEYLRRGTEVSQRYHGLGERGVPPALDAKVLRQAQAQAAKSSSRRRSWLRLGAPLAFAATALIAITVVMQPEVNAPSAPQPMAESQQSAAEGYDAAAAAQEQALAPEQQSGAAEQDSAASGAVQAPRAAEPAPVAATQQSASRPRAADAGGARADSNAAADRGTLEDTARAAAESERIVSGVFRRGEPIEDVPVIQPFDEITVLKDLSPPPQSVDQLSATREERAAKRKLDEEPAKAAQAPSAPTPPAAAPAPPPPPPSQVVAELQRDQAPPAPEPAREGVSTLEVDRAISPSQWVRWIRDFRAQNNPARAEELLKRLRAAHPSFELPADIAPPPQAR